MMNASDHDAQLFNSICELTAVSFALCANNNPGKIARYGFSIAIERTIKHLEAMKADISDREDAPPQP